MGRPRTNKLQSLVLQTPGKSAKKSKEVKLGRKEKK